MKISAQGTLLFVSVYFWCRRVNFTQPNQETKKRDEQKPENYVAIVMPNTPSDERQELHHVTAPSFVADKPSSLFII
jgi:hypothetical protein